MEEIQLINQSKRSPRQGWEALFSKMSENTEDRLSDDPLPTNWDEEE